jgi:glycosyltransferase involved in cell wall biosynthesis
MSTRPQVVVLRGTAANPWELRAWEPLLDEFAVDVVIPENNQYDVTGVRLGQRPARTAGSVLPGGRPGALALKAVGERYLRPAELLAGADIVHAAELGYWFTAQAARLRRRLGFQLVVTVWETLPFADAYRNVRTRPYRRRVLEAADLFLATTERARDALLLEGAAPGRIEIAPPGIDIERFGTARTAAPPADGTHLVLSIGRLVWEKGHQDLLRAVALLRARGRHDVRVLIVGVGPEEARLRAVADDLGLRDAVEFRGWVPYDELPAVYASASALVLASLPTPFWEEQFGMVLAEAMAAHLPIVAADSGAIPEVLAGTGRLVPSGDWVGLANTLAAGPLAGPPGTRQAPVAGQLTRFGIPAAAERLRSAYRRLA